MTDWTGVNATNAHALSDEHSYDSRNSATRFRDDLRFAESDRIADGCHRRRWLLVLVLLGALPRCAAAAEQVAVEESNLLQHVQVLASDTLRGRQAGSTESKAAAVYIVDQLEQAGLVAAGVGGSFYQEFGRGYRNILARVPREQADSPTEVVVIGAHYDHVGLGNRGNSYGPYGQIHNGADDNASGTAVLLELARLLSNEGHHTRREILLAFWDAEEEGLLGAKHWVNSPTVPLERVVVYFNLDMVGRLRDSLTIYGSRTASGMQMMATQANATVGLHLEFDWQVRGDSDHFPFFERRIPFLMFFTGMHGDYHRPSDDVGKLNLTGMGRVTEFVRESVLSASRSNRPFRFRPESSQESNALRRQWLNLPSRPGRLGVRWRQSDDASAVRITGITRGGPADNAGLRINDRITRFHRLPISGKWDFRSLVLSAPRRVEVELQRDASSGKSEPTTELVMLELNGTPRRFGLSWRNDIAEPDSVLVTRVDDGGPAAVGGLQVGDRIQQVDDWAVESAEALRARLAVQIEDCVFHVQRAGMVLVLSVSPVRFHSSKSPRSLGN